MRTRLPQSAHILAQNIARTRNILKFIEPLPRALRLWASTAPDGWWFSPNKQAKVRVVSLYAVGLQVLFLKLMSVQSANTRVYVLGRTLFAS